MNGRWRPGSTGVAAGGGWRPGAATAAARRTARSWRPSRGGSSACSAARPTTCSMPAPCFGPRAGWREVRPSGWATAHTTSAACGWRSWCDPAGPTGRVSALLAAAAALGLDVGLDHHADQLGEGHLRLPAQPLTRPRGVTGENVHLGRSLEARVGLEQVLPLVDARGRASALEQLADRD